MRKWFLMAGLLALSGAAQAGGILQIRGGAGVATADSNALDDRLKAAGQNGINANDFQTYNVDVFIDLPGSPIGFGVRQEWLNLNENSGASKAKLNASNTSALVDLRLLDTPSFYLGPIVGIGYPTSKVKFSNGTATVDKHVSGKPSYNAGVEAGVYLGRFIIGAEAGYQQIRFNKAGGSDNSLDGRVDAKGAYAKGMVGLAFF